MTEEAGKSLDKSRLAEDRFHALAGSIHQACGGWKRSHAHLSRPNGWISWKLILYMGYPQKTRTHTHTVLITYYILIGSTWDIASTQQYMGHWHSFGSYTTITGRCLPKQNTRGKSCLITAHIGQPHPNGKRALLPTSKRLQSKFWRRKRWSNVWSFTRSAHVKYVKKMVFPSPSA